MTEFQAWIIRQRKRAGMTRLELSKFLGVSRDCVDKWETGERKPRPLTRVTIAMMLKDRLSTSKP